MTSESDARVPGRPVGQRGARAREHGQRVRRFYVLTAASTLVPGLGLIPSRRKTGWTMVVLFVLGLLFVCGFAMTKGLTSSVIRVGVSGSVLLFGIFVVIVGAVAWIWGIITTARDNFPEGMSTGPKIAMILFTVIASLLVFAPATQAVRYANIQRGVLNTVFDSIRPDGAVGPGDGDDPWAGTDRVNVMLVGSDAGPNRTGVRPDAVIVASVDTQTGETILFGIPRNLEDIPFSADNPLSEKYPDGYNCGNDCLLEYVWMLGEENADLFDTEDPGLAVTKDAASQILGLDIDYTSVVDLDGFQELVDAMGGVTINVKERVCIGCELVNGTVVGTTGYIEPGKQHLDGFEALWYSRSRAESKDGDFSRMRRQRCMVGALLDQVDPKTMVLRYPALAKTLEDNVRVDIPRQDLDEWADLVLRIQDADKIKSLPLTNQNIDVTDPDYAKIHAMVDKAIDPPEPSSKPKPSPSSSEPEPDESSSSSTPPKDQLSDIDATC